MRREKEATVNIGPIVDKVQAGRQTQVVQKYNKKYDNEQRREKNGKTGGVCLAMKRVEWS